MDIKAERVKRGLSREQMADILGVSYRTVDAWENQRRNPSKQVKMLIESGILDKKKEE